MSAAAKSVRRVHAVCQAASVLTALILAVAACIFLKWQFTGFSNTRGSLPVMMTPDQIAAMPYLDRPPGAAIPAALGKPFSGRLPAMADR